MATIITKRGNGVPTVADLSEGEQAIDLLTGRVYTLSGGVVIELGVDPHVIDYIDDVDTTTTPPADGDVLTYDGATNTWKPSPPPAGGNGGMEKNFIGAENAWLKNFQHTYTPLLNPPSAMHPYNVVQDYRDQTNYPAASGGLADAWVTRVLCLFHDNFPVGYFTFSPANSLVYLNGVGTNTDVVYHGMRNSPFQQCCVVIYSFSMAEMISRSVSGWEYNVHSGGLDINTGNTFGSHSMYADFLWDNAVYNPNDFVFNSANPSPNAALTTANKPNGLGFMGYASAYGDTDIANRGMMQSTNFPLEMSVPSMNMGLNALGNLADYPKNFNQGYIGMTRDTGSSANIVDSFDDPTVGVTGPTAFGGNVTAHVIIGKR